MDMNAVSRRIILYFLLILIVVPLGGGCAFFGNVKKDNKYLLSGEISVARPGEKFFSYDRQGQNQKDKSGKSFVVSLIMLNDKEFILKQVAYQKEKEKGKWVALPGVRTYTFPTTIENVEIMGFSFLVLSIDDGKIRYKRIK